MRKTIIAMLAGLMACVLVVAVDAKPKAEVFTIPNTTTNSTGSVTLTGVSGYIDEIITELPSGTAVTGVVTVVATPVLGDPVVLATNTITADKTFRVRLDGTDSAGAALTNEPQTVRYMAIGDVLTYTLHSANTTNLAWRVLVKWDDGTQ